MALSDRTSASLFGELFAKLGTDTTAIKEGLRMASTPEAIGLLNQGDYIASLASHLWKMAAGYDFHPVQIGAADSLVVLGLAQERQDDHDEYQIRFANDDGTWPEWES